MIWKLLKEPVIWELVVAKGKALENWLNLSIINMQMIRSKEGESGRPEICKILKYIVDI